MAIRIAGEIDKSLPAAVKLSKAELRQIARDAAQTANSVPARFSNGVKQTKGFFGGLEKVAVKSFKVVAGAAATAATGISAYSIKVGSEYEKQMSTVKALSGASNEAFKSLDATAQELGRTTVWSASEVGQAMEYEAMAGWKSSQMIAGTAGIMNLASASGEDLAMTSDIVTDALTAFKLQAEDTSMFVDVLAATATNSNTKVSMLGESFKYAAPLAGTLGFSVQDTAQALGLMANAGIKASNAGTSTRAWLTRMAKPTKESAAAMKDLKLSMTDSHGKMKSLNEIMQETRNSFNGLTKTEKTRYAAMLAGKQGMSGLLAIVNASEKDYKKLAKAIDTSSGAADKMSKVKLDNLEGDVTLFKSAMEGAGITIYDELKEPLRDLVQTGTEWVTEFANDFATTAPTLIQGAEDIGSAIGTFADPFLQVGGWLVDHPTLIVGTITGIGGALITYKVASGISNMATALTELSTGGVALIGVTAAVGVVSGLAAAVAEAEAAAKDASLKDHFGKVALSMDELKTAAAQIVGQKDLEYVTKLLNSEEKTNGIISSLNGARDALNRVTWKTSVGIKLDKSELQQYQKDVKSYVEDAQKLVDEKGYQVNIATKLLFGDSAEGAEIIADNNAFYQKLDLETNNLSKEINKKLSEAMKKGLTIDLQNEINDLLDQLSDITAQISEAESQADWQLMKEKWTGSDLTPESFENLSKQVDENVSKMTSGADDAYKKSLINLNAQKNSGNLSQAEFDKRVKQAQQKRDELKDEAKVNAQDFYYNTLMDTYGKELKTGEMPGYGDAENIQDMIDAINKYASSKGNKYADQMKAFSQVVSQDDYDTTGLAGTDEEVRQALYARNKEAKDKAQNYASLYLNNKDNETADIFSKHNTALFKGIEKEATNAGTNAGDLIKKGATTSLRQGIIDNVPITLYGDYTIRTSTVSSSGYTTSGEAAKKAKNAAAVSKGSGKNSVPYLSIFKMPGHATGGIFSRPHVAMFAEEPGVSESAIPIKNDANSWNLWSATGQMLYKKSGINLGEAARKMDQISTESTATTASSTPVVINYSPNITINGNASEEMVQSALQDDYARFKNFMNRYNKNKRRVSLKEG